MHTYIKHDDGGFEVAFVYAAGGQRPMRRFMQESEAAAYVNYLNGGSHPNMPWQSTDYRTNQFERVP